ncbi:GNAT family N-acetyltransferase [Paenibacillus camerounensis]|uniref:GNAT family N-acetyltransferase n=1 Tax=Paenibacillus camerounensis TaxID=1243663 RepID=UPI0005A7D3B4|nr:GNAT family N-acetyltransferase [Paenibacillus camerounensis]
MLICLRDYWNQDAVKELLALCMAAGGEAAEQEMNRYFTGDSGDLFGCFVNGELSGIIGLRLEGGHTAQIRHIAVKPGWQGKGIGRGMIAEVSRADGVEKLTAETDHETAGFYRNAGFAVTSLGEKYPGVERFACVFSVKTPAQSRM